MKLTYAFANSDQSRRYATFLQVFPWKVTLYTFYFHYSRAGLYKAHRIVEQKQEEVVYRNKKEKSDAGGSRIRSIFLLHFRQEGPPLGK